MTDIWLITHAHSPSECNHVTACVSRDHAKTVIERLIAAREWCSSVDGSAEWIDDDDSSSRLCYMAEKLTIDAGATTA